MDISKEKVREQAARQFYIRRLTKSGASRYLSIGTLLPLDWQAVKVYVEQLDKGICVLRLVQIK